MVTVEHDSAIIVVEVVQQYFCPRSYRLSDGSVWSLHLATLRHCSQIPAKRLVLVVNPMHSA